MELIRRAQVDPRLAQAITIWESYCWRADKRLRGAGTARSSAIESPAIWKRIPKSRPGIESTAAWNESAELLGKVLEKRGNDANAHCQSQ